MSHNSPTHPSTMPTTRAIRRRARIVLLAITLACLALNACGRTSDLPNTAAAREARLAHQERAQLLELVSCGRQHGIPMPAPTAEDKIDMRGVNLKIHGRKAALNTCYHKIVKKAAKEQQTEQAREPKPPENRAAEQASAQAAAVHEQEHERMTEIVNCARRHGIHLPEPDAHNNINTHGINLKSHRNKAAMGLCIHEVVIKTEKEQAELAREQARGPRRLGEEPTG